MNCLLKDSHFLSQSTIHADCLLILRLDYTGSGNKMHASAVCLGEKAVFAIVVKVRCYDNVLWVLDFIALLSKSKLGD